MGVLSELLECADGLPRRAQLEGDARRLKADKRVLEQQLAGAPSCSSFPGAQQPPLGGPPQLAQAPWQPGARGALGAAGPSAGGRGAGLAYGGADLPPPGHGGPVAGFSSGGLPPQEPRAPIDRSIVQQQRDCRHVEGTADPQWSRDDFPWTRDINRANRDFFGNASFRRAPLLPAACCLWRQPPEH